MALNFNDFLKNEGFDYAKKTEERNIIKNSLISVGLESSAAISIATTAARVN